MHLEILFYLFAFILVFQVEAQVEITTKWTLNPTQSRTQGPKKCKTLNKEDGICVHKSTCNQYYKIETGGIIIESELRISPDCNILAGEWCCAWKNETQPVTTSSVTIAPTANTVSPVTVATVANTVPPVTVATVSNTVPPAVVVPTVKTVPPTIPKQGRNCIATDQNDCPWLVKLYRSGEDYPYCLGAMIGSKVILTTATCEKQAQDRFLWATIPSSANAEANYTILTKLRHPKYNSGSRLNDIALFSTISNVEWGSNGPKGACIDPQQTIAGQCTAANLNEYYDMDVVPLYYVTQGACTRGGNVSDAMCGTGMFTNNLFHGTPIMCQKNNMYILSGLTKRAYDSEKALLGNLDYAWLVYNLKETFGLKDEDFLYRRNYL